MNWQVGYKKTFLKDLKGLPKDKREKIEKFVFEEIFNCKNPLNLKGIEKLIGYDKYYKIRFGDYRVGLEIDKNKKKIIFCKVLHRKEIIFSLNCH